MEINNASLPDFSGKDLTGCRKNSQNVKLEKFVLFARYYSGAHTNNGEGEEGSRNTYRILVVKLEETRELHSSGLLRSE
jgi:arginyl-tRNA--protein-N-Asp/Glu arginylyltransferase